MNQGPNIRPASRMRPNGAPNVMNSNGKPITKVASRLSVGDSDDNYEDDEWDKNAADNEGNNQNIARIAMLRDKKKIDRFKEQQEDNAMDQDQSK